MLWQTFPHLLARSANLLLSDQSKAGHNLHIFQLQLLSDHLFWPRRRVNRNNHYFAAGRRKGELKYSELSLILFRIERDERRQERKKQTEESLLSTLSCSSTWPLMNYAKHFTRFCSDFCYSSLPYVSCFSLLLRC